MNVGTAVDTALLIIQGVYDATGHTRHVVQGGRKHNTKIYNKRDQPLAVL